MTNKINDFIVAKPEKTAGRFGFTESVRLSYVV